MKKNIQYLLLGVLGINEFPAKIRNMYFQLLWRQGITSLTALFYIRSLCGQRSCCLHNCGCVCI